MPSNPQSQEDWTVHAINIHGVFFERRCADVISSAKGYTLKTANYPVEFPPPNGPIRGKESTLDLRAERQNADFKTTLLIECKKNNPEFVNWVFFPKQPVQSSHSFIVTRLENFKHEGEATGWRVEGSLEPWNASGVLTNEARETKGDYLAYKKDGHSKTKTANAAISEAAYQVALAARAIGHEEHHFSTQLGSSPLVLEMPWRVQRIFPIIVTTARLFVCDFSPSAIAPGTGEIEYENAKLSERSDLVYEYALPRHLQTQPKNLIAALSDDLMESFARMHILVVSSSNFPSWLESFLRE